jgi:hypothetical protein
MDGNLGGRAYLIAQLKERGLSRRRSLRVLNHIFREIEQALARGEEVEFAGGRLLRAAPWRLSRRWYNEEDWPADWPLWTVVWVPHWEMLLRCLGPEEAQKKAFDLFFDVVFMKEYLSWERAERKRAAESRKQSRRKFGKGPKKAPLSGK